METVQRPLTGVRVIELEQHMGAPDCTMLDPVLAFNERMVALYSFAGESPACGRLEHLSARCLSLPGRGSGPQRARRRSVALDL
jgi:hypothetical protein